MDFKDQKPIARDKYRAQTCVMIVFICYLVVGKLGKTSDKMDIVYVKF